MSQARYDLPCLVLEHYQVKEALEIVLHTILFYRAINQIEVIDKTSEHFDVRLMRIFY